MGLFNFFKKKEEKKQTPVQGSQINVYSLKNEIINNLSSNYGLKFEGEIKTSNDDGSSYLVLTNSITHQSYKGGIYCKFIVFPSGSLSVEFVFDKIRKDDYVIQLLHEFNKNIAFLAAYVRDDGYLVVHYNVADLDGNDMWDNIRRCVNSLSNETIEKYLSPLAQLTYSEN